MTPEQLKASILQCAIQGKLVEQRPEEGTGEELYRQIQAEKKRLLQDGKIKKEKPLPEIAEDEIPFDIPESWKWARLGDCCEMYTGNSISESVKKAKYAGINVGLDYIATKDVTFGNSIVYDNGVRIPEDEGFKIARSGSVLMCIEGGSAGRKIGVIDRDVCFGNKLCMFNSNLASNLYLFFFLQSSAFKQFFSRSIVQAVLFEKYVGNNWRR